MLSTNAIRLIEISLTAEQARSRAVAVTSWLLDRGVITPNWERDAELSPSEFRAGPQCAAVAPGSFGHGGVDVVVERQVHHAVENYEPPTCPGCGYPAIYFDAHHALIEPWLFERAEASVRCVACGRSSLVGNLGGHWSFHIGDLAVVFHDWPPLTEEFVAELGAVMGPRTRMVIAHL
ncbi:hypothetical protein ACIA8G_03655 [Lentzea sp. NPDC051213]|uniref:hypothetical protein n=1 Tax=Lentzea sp. NPDC051213 TaxID=3364126 RepID=UPI0037918DF3